MPRYTRRSQAKAAVDNTQGGSIDPFLTLQPATENNVTTPSHVVYKAGDQSARKKRTYSSYEASNGRTAPASTKTQPAVKVARKRGRISDQQETLGSSKENRHGKSGRDGETQHGNAGNKVTNPSEVAIGRRSSRLNRSDTHNAPTTLLDEDSQFGIGNVESDVEEEDDWFDEETPCHPTRQSEAMALERATWVEDGTSPTPGSQNTHGSGDTLGDGDDVSHDAGSSVAHHATLTPTWPVETNMVFSAGRNRIGLLNQQSMVRHVLQDAIEYIHLYLMIHHSFPRSGAAVEGTRAALVKASRSRLPGAAGILNRILYDEEYFLNMSVIPRARIPIIRNGIKERFGLMVAGEYAALDPPKIAELVAKEKEFYNYIYPVARVGVSGNDRLLKRSQPYRNQRIMNVIRSVYFTGGASSLARRFDIFFPRHTNSEGVKNPEMPKPLVALVATALYSATQDWQSGKKVPIDFTVEGYSDVYDGNINTLNNLEARYPNKYHTMMRDIYVKASSTVSSINAVPIADIPIAELDG